MEEKNNLNIKPDEIMIPEGLPGGFFIYNAEGNFEILYADQNIIALYECKDIAEFREFTGNSFTGMVHPDDFKKIDNDIMAQTFNSSKKHDYVRYRIITRSGAVKYIEDFGHLLHGRNGEKYFYVYIVDIDKDEFYNTLGDIADLNGDVGQQWLAMYCARNDAEAPILADSLKVVAGNSQIPAGYSKGAHMFGTDAAENINNTLYIWNSGAKSIYLYYKQAEAIIPSLAGSGFSGGVVALSAGAGLGVGALASGLLVNAFSKRKKKEEQE